MCSSTKPMTMSLLVTHFDNTQNRYVEKNICVAVVSGFARMSVCYECDNNLNRWFVYLGHLSAH